MAKAFFVFFFLGYPGHHNVYVCFMCVQEEERTAAETCLQVYERVVEAGGETNTGVSKGEDPTALYIRTQRLSPYLLLRARALVSEHQVNNHKPQS